MGARTYLELIPMTIKREVIEDYTKTKAADRAALQFGAAALTTSLSCKLVFWRSPKNKSGGPRRTLKSRDCFEPSSGFHDS
jgi:hypothetical protein